MLGVPALWIKLAACALVVVVLGWSHLTAYRNGKDSILSRLQSDRVTILQDGKRIDETALAADDNLLCNLLGGCRVSDNPDTD